VIPSSQGIGGEFAFQNIDVGLRVGAIVKGKLCARCGVPVDEVVFGMAWDADALNPQMRVEFYHHREVDVLLLSHKRLGNEHGDEYRKAERFKPFEHVRLAETGGCL